MVAPVMAIVSAVALAGVLTGCRAQSSASQPAGVTGPAGSVTSPADSATSPAGGAMGPAGAGVDSDLNSVDGQLSGIDSALAQATQSPSDGG